MRENTHTTEGNVMVSAKRNLTCMSGLLILILTSNYSPTPPTQLSLFRFRREVPRNLPFSSIRRYKMKQLVVTLTVGIGLLSLAFGADLDLEQRFLLLATKKTSTMQKELNEASSAGYRIVSGSPTSGSEMALILEKVVTPPNNYEYMLLATTKTSTMQKELQEAASQGFQLLPSTMISKGRTFGGPEIIVVLEKVPGGYEKYDYLLLATTKTSTLQKEMSEAIEEGYEVVGMVSRGEHMVILERPAKATLNE